MKNDNLPMNSMLLQLAKKEKQLKWREGNVIVTYTRVSDASQFDNTSLETQKKDAITYAQRRDYIIKAFFGGVVESAKTDERKEFKRMLDYVKKDTSISAILVYSYERFSRSEHASELVRSLRKLGVKVLSIIQEVDVTTAAGRLQQDIFFSFGNYDNEIRREKSIRGMVENLEDGYWVGIVPEGYTNLRRKEKAKYHEYVINEQGELLKLAFKWKAEGKLSNLEIVDKLRKMGSKINYKSFTRIICNPFYIGYIANSLIPGKLVKGHHPPLISVEIFMKANGIVNSNPHKGIAKNFKKPELPLKSFMKDDLTEIPFTGYIQKGIYYYKTRNKQKGLAVNERADTVHELFKEEINKLAIDEKHVSKIEEYVKEIVLEKFKVEMIGQQLKKRRITELNDKIEKLEERYVEGEIDKELYVKHTSKYRQEQKQVEEEIAKNNFESSNLEKAIKKGVGILSKPLILWEESDYDDKQRLQYLMFPEGIRYNKEKRAVRTPRINSVFALIADTARVLGDNKKGHLVKSDLNSRLVVPTRIELVSKV